MKLIKTRHGLVALLTNKETHPSKEWLNMQSIPPLKDKSLKWFTAYPICGGAVSCQEGTFEVMREATQADIDQACGDGSRGFNPAGSSIKGIWEAEKLEAGLKRGELYENIFEK